jgi:hypothetical protein
VFVVDGRGKAFVSVQGTTINNQQTTNNKIHNCYLIEKTFGILVVGEVNG